MSKLYLTQLLIIAQMVVVLICSCESNTPVHEPMSKTELNLYLSKAEQGDPENQYFVALIYDLGNSVEGRKCREAFKWFHAAADQGHTEAQDSLGYFYEC
ncbi:MAG: hypothetical protein LBE27_00540, partial [Deltaproteobacteria bacterium]|nr:hypothetical protein [Deltaproteobacteria bacterium]